MYPKRIEPHLDHDQELEIIYEAYDGTDQVVYLRFDHFQKICTAFSEWKQKFEDPTNDFS